MYRLNIDVRIEQVDERGCRTGGELEVREHLDLPNVSSFLDIAAILGRFHELRQEIAHQQVGRGAKGDPPYPACKHRPDQRIYYYEPCPECLGGTNQCDMSPR